jgi:hypothetical protein
MSLDQFNIPDLRPLIIYGFLLSSLSYVVYQSAPRFGLKKMKGVIYNQTCVGSTSPFGCRLEVEYTENNVVQQRTFTGSFPTRFNTFDEIDVWVDPHDPNNSTVQYGWSKEGIFFAGILLLILVLYHRFRK